MSVLQFRAVFKEQAQEVRCPGGTEILIHETFCQCAQEDKARVSEGIIYPKTLYLTYNRDDMGMSLLFVARVYEK
jgi:hypothetical protein